MNKPFAIMMLMIGLLGLLPLSASAALTPVDERDDDALQASASLAFYKYLEAIDRKRLVDANKQVLDPGDEAGRESVFNKLIGFMRGRQKNPVRNEAAVIRCSGDWAMVVYQYDTTIAGKTARVITTAWMVQWEGFWRQFIVDPADEGFWDSRQDDYDRLQKWFDDHAEELSAL